MGILGEMEQNHRRDMQLYNSIFSLLCYEKIGFTGTGIRYDQKSGWTVVVCCFIGLEGLLLTAPLIVDS